MEKRNEKTLRAAIIATGNFEFFDNVKDSQGKAHTFFTLGGESGYVSPRAAEVLRTKGANGIDELRYAECQQNPGDEWVPTIMLKGGLTATMSISAADL